MSLPSPNLDDRTFEQLVKECQDRISQSCPEWTDRTPHDPGIVLMELFAFLTEAMIYRLNRVPDKAYIEFLRLLGVKLEPPAAASVTLRFTRSRDLDRPLDIPRGTRVALTRASGSSEPVVFVTDTAAVIPPGEAEAGVEAHHCEPVGGELAALAPGLPGFSVTAKRPPIIASTATGLDLIVGVESPPEEFDERAPARLYETKRFRIWREVDSFVNLGDDPFAYVADRATGTITFAPAVRMTEENGRLAFAPGALGAIPPAGREIRLWYKRGGGASGNVAAKAKWTLKDPLPGVEVTNPQAATGGRPAESLDNALLRGPQEIHSLQRAVTARDFQLVAERTSGAVIRAKAVTVAQIWKYAGPGTVEVLLVPYIPEEERGGGNVTVARLREAQTEDARASVQAALDERRPLGTLCRVNWARYKTARVAARVVAYQQEDPAALRQRVTEKLHLVINPLPTKLQREGWPFGEALRAFHVYDSVISEPGVSYVDHVRLLVDEVPGSDITCLLSDPFHPRVWYAGTGEILFRSTNDTLGWEPAGRFVGRKVYGAVAHPERPGLLAAITRGEDNSSESQIQISSDSGESWENRGSVAFNVRGLAWIQRGSVPVLFLAADTGLFELASQPGATPVQIAVQPAAPDTGFYSVAAAANAQGETKVAVVAQGKGGVFLSSQGGKPGSFRHIGLKGEDVRTSAMQYDGARLFLWIGTAASGGDDGKGARRWELTGSGDPPEGWLTFEKGWKAGSCFGFAFQGSLVLAASHHGGVLRLDGTKSDAAWQTPDFASGLPLRETGRLHSVQAVATDPRRSVVLAAGSVGVYASSDAGLHYGHASATQFNEVVTIPDTWLFCSGAHEIEVVSEDEAG